VNSNSIKNEMLNVRYLIWNLKEKLLKENLNVLFTKFEEKSKENSIGSREQNKAYEAQHGG
jgi:hypothetical protein